MIILDFETNSNNPKDVLEVGALKIKKENDSYTIVETFHRYYYSQYKTNPWALKVHNLSPTKIKILRKEKSYPKFFADDSDFILFCQNCTTLIAHNISFELRYLDSIVLFKKHFCTMKENKKLVNVLNKNGRPKNPTLKETCNYYKINFDDNRYHNALYDAEQTFKIVRKMKSI